MGTIIINAIIEKKIINDSKADLYISIHSSTNNINKTMKSNIITIGIMLIIITSKLKMQQIFISVDEIPGMADNP